MVNILGHGLGRRVSEFSIPRKSIAAIAKIPAISVEVKLNLPKQYITKYDQGREGACVGFSLSWMMSIQNRKFYDAPWLYKEAQKVDPWVETPPEEGTSVSAGCKVLIDQGHRRIWGGLPRAISTKEGIEQVRWARTIDELRAALYLNISAVLGINWYSNFDNPQWDDKNGWTIGRGDLGRIRGGHAICVYGCSDKRECVKLVNTWGNDYPQVWVPYNTIQRLLDEDGECCLVTDR